jgi:murein DD-endopeptidase MepM/ murein hydrolase activator NlpD
LPLKINALENLDIYPEKPIQGDVLIIQTKNLTKEDISKILFDGKSLWFFNYQNRATAFWGSDLNQKPGLYTIKIIKESGEVIEEKIEIKKREKYEAPLGIPEKLGGNTKEAGQKLVSNLDKENSEINSLKSLNKKLWLEKFSYPLKDITITDEYGYSRNTVGNIISHKGTDFRAQEGTPVYAINSGYINKAKKYIVYGNTVIIDHGLGAQSLYMHLSRIDVKNGQYVKKGEQIGLAGKTGYAESSHLHLSIKINGKSIDPYKFLEFFK